MERISKTTILRFKYNSEEERANHVAYMEGLGYECTGQVRRSDDSYWDIDRYYYWYGEFHQVTK